MQTGENEQGLRKILDMTRMISIVILALHFYYYCYRSFEVWGLHMHLTDRLIVNIKRTGLFDRFITSKLIAVGFLIISLIGAKGRKDETLNYKSAFAYIISGLSIYFISYFSFFISMDNETKAIVYMGITSLGFILVLTGGTLLSRIIGMKFNNRDIFNKENETFPQEERLLENEYSINLPAKYHLKGKIRKSWINIINPFAPSPHS